MSQTIRFGSVCSGIEAASVAWGPIGWQAAWFAEIEAFPSAVLAHHYPDVSNLGDMTRIARMVRFGEVEAPDVLCGGTPCQAFSVAGLRRSLDDERGNLTLKFVELADAVDHVRSSRGKAQCIVFWENVPGVLSTKDNAFGCFLAGLAGEDEPLHPPGGKWRNAGAVYGPKRAVAWRTLDAQYFGLAQRRRRVFVVASARDGFDPAEVLFEWDGVRRDTAPSREARQGSAAGTLRSTDGGCDVDHARAGHIQPVAFGGNNTSGPISQAAALNANRGCHNPGDFEAGTLLVQAAAIVPFDTTQVTSSANRSNPKAGDPCHPLAAGAHPPAIAFSAKDYGGDAMSDLSPTLRAGGHNHSHANAGVMPAIAFHPTQDPISSTDGTTHCMGTGSSVGKATIAVAVSLRGREGGATAELGNEVGNCLRASSGGGDKPHVLTAMQVRRLTPTECERLQGFPDGWTQIPWRNKPAIECPDGPRYKALGNSWPVNVVRWLGMRITRSLRTDQ